MKHLSSHAATADKIVSLQLKTFTQSHSRNQFTPNQRWGKGGC